MKVDNGKTENIIADEFETKEEATIVEQDEFISTSADETRTTPNTVLILKKYYSDCGHTITNKSEIPPEMVNLNKDELSRKYLSWKIEEFSKEEAVLSKQLDSFCGEHYLIIEEDNNVSIYSINEDGNRNLKEVTDIAFEYLPETDKIILSNGIYVYGVEELNKIREDFES